MSKFEPSHTYRSAGIVMEDTLIEALDQLAAMMSGDGAVVSRSEIARDLLWAGITLIRSKDPKSTELLQAMTEAAEAA